MPAVHDEELNLLRHRYRPEAEAFALGHQATWHPRNRVAIYYRQSQERAFIQLLDQTGLELDRLRILDFGCGSGVQMRFLISLGALPNNIFAFDLMEHRVQLARNISPASLNLMVANAEIAPLQSSSFDMISQFVVFSSIHDARVRATIAAEIMRLLRPGGCLFWYDSRSGVHKAGFSLELSDLAQLFPTMTVVYVRFLHAVRLSSVIRRSWSLAWIWDRLPFIKRTHLLAVLQKPD
jgi:SAM-dependent methyltransferase